MDRQLISCSLFYRLRLGCRLICILKLDVYVTRVMSRHVVVVLFPGNMLGIVSSSQVAGSFPLLPL